MESRNLPRCRCGARIGLITRNGVTRCGDCLWNEVERLQSLKEPVGDDSLGQQAYAWKHLWATLEELGVYTHVDGRNAMERASSFIRHLAAAAAGEGSDDG